MTPCSRALMHSHALLTPQSTFMRCECSAPLPDSCGITVYISPWFLVYPPLYIAGIYNHDIRNRRDFSACISGLDPMSVICVPHPCKALVTQLFKHNVFLTKAATSAKFCAMWRHAQPFPTTFDHPTQQAPCSPPFPFLNLPHSHTALDILHWHVHNHSRHIYDTHHMWRPAQLYLPLHIHRPAQALDTFPSNQGRSRVSLLCTTNIFGNVYRYLIQLLLEFMEGWESWKWQQV